jgi:hypothetical protein
MHFQAVTSPTEDKEGIDMFDLDVTVRSPRIGNCAQCGREVMANIQMLSDAPVVCSKCRCLVCRIVLSEDVCRCGIAHGKPSALKQVCARCYELIQAGAFSQPSLGIVTDAVSSFEQTIMDEGLDDEMDDGFDESEEADFNETIDEMLDSSDDQELLMNSDTPEESIATA